MNNHDEDSARNALVAMLRCCADYLDDLPAGKVDALMKGELELRLSVISKKRTPKHKKVTSPDATQVADIATRLHSLDNRADGEALLRNVASTKSALETVARYLDIAVRREDRQDDLIHRIVESTIGYRLSSAAIKGPTISRNRDKN
jgi:hypothetical protein